MEKANNGPCRRILFLISLPSTQEFLQDQDEVEMCLDELKQLNVDVKNHFHADDLADIMNYDIVIIVAHYDFSSDSLLLEDGLLTMDGFLSSLPSEYKGTIDLSFCNSALFLQNVKQRCPDAHFQVALNSVPLLRRVIIYPELVRLLRVAHDIEYSTAYNKVSEKFNKVYDELSVDDPSDVYMNLLGKRMTSLYAPSQIVKNQTFWIYLFFYYDTDRQTINVMVNDWMAKKVQLEQHEIFFPLKQNSPIVAKLNVKTAGSSSVLLLNGSEDRHFYLSTSPVVESFLLKILPDFNGNVVSAEIKLSNDGIQFLSCSFTINIGDKILKNPALVSLDKMIMPDDELQILQAYARIPNTKLLKNIVNIQFDRFELNRVQTLNQSELYTLLNAVREFVYSNKMFFNAFDKTLKVCEDKLVGINNNASTDVDISVGLIANMMNFSCYVRQEYDRLLTKFNNLRGHTFFEIEHEFILLEAEFLDFVKDMILINDQVFMLDTICKINELIKKIIGLDNEADKENLGVIIKYKKDIKQLATDFFQRTLDNGTDIELFELFKKGGTKSTVHTKTNSQVTMPFLALLIAVAKGEFVSQDYGKNDWYLNVLDYIDLGDVDYGPKARMQKLRINSTVELLENNELRDAVRRYQMTKPGSISVAAFLLLRMKTYIYRP